MGEVAGVNFALGFFFLFFSLSLERERRSMDIALILSDIMDYLRYRNILLIVKLRVLLFKSSEFLETEENHFGSQAG